MENSMAGQNVYQKLKLEFKEKAESLGWKLTNEDQSNGRLTFRFSEINPNARKENRQTIDYSIDAYVTKNTIVFVQKGLPQKVFKNCTDEEVNILLAYPSKVFSE